MAKDENQPPCSLLVLNTTFKGIAIGVYTTTASGDLPKVRSIQLVTKSHSAALRLPALVNDVLAEAGTTLAELGGIAVAHGPGSFTGIKIGLSFVQGLAAGEGQPVLGLDALACLSCYGAKLGVADLPWVLAQNRRKGYLYQANAEPRCLWLAPELRVSSLSADTADDAGSQPWSEAAADIDKVMLVTPWAELSAALPPSVTAVAADEGDLIEGRSLAAITLAAMALGFGERWFAGGLSSPSPVSANYITPSTPEERQLAARKGSNGQ